MSELSDVGELISRRDVSKHFPMISRFQLDKWAQAGCGPDYFVIGRTAFYHRSEIENFIKNCESAAREKRRRLNSAASAAAEAAPPARPGRPKKKPTT